MSEDDFEGSELASKRRLEGIVASAMDAIITINEEQRVILFNPAAEQMFGTSREDALGQPISRFIPHRFRSGHEEHIRRFRDTGVTARRMGALGAISGLRSDGTEFPIEASISQVDIAGESLSTVILRDITERIANEDARLLLAREVDHRAKNALAVVQALVSLTTAPTKDEFIQAVRGRVAALGRAHSLLAQNRWTGGNLERIVKDETSAYCKPGQLRCSGPDIVLMPNAVQPIGLLIHELATNAVKHGALSAPAGKVQVSWTYHPGHDLSLRWEETGVAEVRQPTTQGFGSTLIDTVARQLGGEVGIDWREGGIVVEATLPPANYRAETAYRPHEAATASAPAQRSDAVPVRPHRVLLVEDELLVAMELAQALESEGWEIIGPAGSLEEAFALLSKNELPDAAILDINLNGQLVYPIADLLRSHGIPYLFCTGYESAAAEPDRYREAPVVRKPTNLQMLTRELRGLFGGLGSPDTQLA